LLSFFLFLAKYLFLMRIAIIGYGKMGKEIELHATHNGHVISHVIDFDNINEIKKINSSNTDVAIEFTSPSSAVKNIISCFENKVPIICGTTGWYSELDNVKNFCSKHNGTLFYSSNFSIGVYFYIEIAKYASKILNELSGYNVKIEETHHTQKLDSPSGTAISLANSILPFLQKYKGWKKLDNCAHNYLPISSKRIDDTTGIHALIFESDADIIEIKHTAKNRKIFAKGAVLAAETFYNKKGIFTMSDLYNTIV